MILRSCVCVCVFSFVACDIMLRPSFLRSVLLRTPDPPHSSIREPIHVPTHPPTQVLLLCRFEMLMLILVNSFETLRNAPGSGLVGQVSYSVLACSSVRVFSLPVLPSSWNKYLRGVHLFFSRNVLYARKIVKTACRVMVRAPT